jgi:hypothetical protein
MRRKSEPQTEKATVVSGSPRQASGKKSNHPNLGHPESGGFCFVISQIQNPIKRKDLAENRSATLQEKAK